MQNANCCFFPKVPFFVLKYLLFCDGFSIESRNDTHKIFLYFFLSLFQFIDLTSLLLPLDYQNIKMKHKLNVLNNLTFN